MDPILQVQMERDLRRIADRLLVLTDQWDKQFALLRSENARLFHRVGVLEEAAPPPFQFVRRHALDTSFAHEPTLPKMVCETTDGNPR